MDSNHFDQLAKWLATGATRRGVLQLLAGVPLLGFLAMALPEESGAARRKRLHGQRKKHKKRKKTCAHVGQATNKKRKKCCKGLVKGADGRCGEPAPDCVVCASGCAFSSVQAAIDAATPGDTITICAGRYVGQVVINASVTLVGAGKGDDPATSTILDSNGMGRVVVVNSGVVALQDLRVTGGDDSIGGGLYNFAETLTLTGCAITGNTGHAGGGGIYNNGGTVTLTGCDITGNTADAADGGGIYNSGGTVRLENCQVMGNTADRGGGVHNPPVSTLVLADGTSITDNTALNAAPSGGGVFNGGTVDASGGSITGNTPDDCVNAGSGTGCS